MVVCVCAWKLRRRPKMAHKTKRMQRIEDEKDILLHGLGITRLDYLPVAPVCALARAIEHIK